VIGTPTERTREVTLLACVLVVAVAGLVYELIAGTLTTYLLGNSVTVFSLVIGVFLASMGLGAFVAKYVEGQLVRTLIVAELALAGVGGLSALALFAAYAGLGDGYIVVLGAICIVIGMLVGVEIPLLVRILERRGNVRVAISHVLALDYVGALLGSVLFPLVLLPFLGLVRSAALFGLLNLAVAVLALRIFRDEVDSRPLRPIALALGVVLTTVLWTGGAATSWLEDQLYEDTVLRSEQTPYQRIVITRWRDDLRLYLGGNLQFSSVDEYRYHETLVHPAMATVESPASVLILGGGDGLAVREVLRHPSVRNVDLVDLDPAITRLAATDPMLRALNEGALDDPRVTTHNADALRFLEQATGRWDLVIMDLPDPNDDGLSRLYSVGAFRLALRRLTDRGSLVTQATSPFFAPEAFWCIVETIEAAVASSPVARSVRPLHALVPSFGEWGFVLVSAQAPQPQALADLPLRFLKPDTLDSLFVFPADLSRRDVEVNHLADARLARYYRRGWVRFRGP
jgi:spermidine synthase